MTVKHPMPRVFPYLCHGQRAPAVPTICADGQISCPEKTVDAGAISPNASR